MKKLFLILLLILPLFSCQENGDNKQDKISTAMDSYIDSLLEQTTSYIPAWNQEGFKGRWNYIDGVFLNSIVNCYKQTSNSKYHDFFIDYINYYIDNDGNFINPQTQTKDGFRATELDSICASRILFDALEFTKDSRYEKAIETTYQALVAMPRAEGSNNFWHKIDYPNQIWLDGMYMYVPFYLRYALKYNREDILAEVLTQYQYIREHMFSEDLKLYYHGHDTTVSIFWSKDNNGNSQSFWLRSIGWYVVSLIDSIEILPEGQLKSYLTDLFKEAVTSILKYQDENSKMFYQLVDKKTYSQIVPAKYFEGLKNTKYQQYGMYFDAEVSNYLESSGSSMIAYCLLKGSNLGLLQTDYSRIGKDVFKGIFEHSFKNGELNDICITAGLGPLNRPYRDGTPAYYLAEPVGANDAKGVGPFIMAYLEYQKAK